MAISSRLFKSSGFAALLVAAIASAGPPGSHGGGFGGGFHGGGFHGSGYARRGFAGGGSAPWAQRRASGYGQGNPGWIGSRVNALPGGFATYRYGGSPYYFAGGCWYRPWNGIYLGCYPPIGLYLPMLPWGCDSFWDDGICYYTYQDVYYTDTGSGGYEVVDPPPGQEPPAPGPAMDRPDPEPLAIVPEKGQDPARMKQDRADAQRYAIQRSGYDPAYGDPSDPGTPRARQAYLKALRSYLEGRGYSLQ